MYSIRNSQITSDESSTPWRHFADTERRVELDIPAHWINQSSGKYLLDLHAPDDPWTAFLLSSHALDQLHFGERVNELVLDDSKRWNLQRKASVIHNGVAAVETDFSLQLNNASWMMRKLYIADSEKLFALAFMTRAATWSRYGAAYRGAHRSFALFHGNPSRAVHPVPQRVADASNSTSQATLML